MNYKNIFSERLLALRKSSKISLQALGDKLGISNQAVSLLEKGRRSPSFEVLLALADYFDVSLDFITGRSDNPNSEKLKEIECYIERDGVIGEKIKCFADIEHPNQIIIPPGTNIRAADKIIRCIDVD